MSLEQLLHEKRAEIEQIAARHGVIRLRVFGSAARGDPIYEAGVQLGAAVENRLPGRLLPQRPLPQRTASGAQPG